MQHPSNDTGVKHCHYDVRYRGVVIAMVSSVASMQTLKSFGDVEFFYSGGSGRVGI